MCYYCQGATEAPYATVGSLLLCSKECLNRFAAEHAPIVAKHGVTATQYGAAADFSIYMRG